MGTGQAAELHGHQADGSEARDGYGVADADVSVAHCAEGKIRRVEADRGLPRDVCGQAARGFGPDVFLAEWSVGKDAVAFFELGDARTQLDDFADAHVAQRHGVLDALALMVEDAQLGVEVAARAGVSLKHRHFSAVLGGRVQAFDADLAC